MKVFISQPMKGLTDEEISFIESMIKPIEVGGDDDGN